MKAPLAEGVITTGLTVGLRVSITLARYSPLSDTELRVLPKPGRSMAITLKGCLNFQPKLLMPTHVQLQPE